MSAKQVVQNSLNSAVKLMVGSIRVGSTEVREDFLEQEGSQGFAGSRDKNWEQGM